MKFIAHRGNIHGPNPARENQPEYLLEAIHQNFDVEVDVWLKEKQIYLGHDQPQYRVDLDFLLAIQDNGWFHAKNVDALKFLKYHLLRCFWHQEDDYALTSHGNIWCYPGKLCPGGIDVLPERFDNWEIPNRDAVAICSDFVQVLRDWKAKK